MSRPLQQFPESMDGARLNHFVELEGSQFLGVISDVGEDTLALLDASSAVSV